MSVTTTPSVRTRHNLRALLNDFDAVLSAEYEALRQRDSDRIETLVATKQRLASDLDKWTPQVREWQASATAEDDEWNTIHNLLGRCALANRTNGAAIDASRCFVTTMLDLLTGRRSTERTYTARGRLGASLAKSSYDRV